MFDVVSIGELLIDFTPIKERQIPTYQQNAGGAPANIAVACAMMGRRAAFVGKVGCDPFGTFLRDTLTSRGVDTSGLCVTEEYHTTLAFVHLTDSGERSFSFFRDPGADLMLRSTDLNLNVIEHTKVFHFGSVSLTADPSRTATLDAVRAAKRSGAIISFDPNLRLSLWKNAEEARGQVEIGMPLADIVKVSEEELSFLTGTDVIDEGVAVLRERNPSVLVLVTKGPNGCDYFTTNHKGSVPSFTVCVLDTTGAGDAFMGTFLAGFLEVGKKMEDLTEQELHHIVRIANASGALTTTRLGGIPALPTKDEVNHFLRVRKD